MVADGGNGVHINWSGHGVYKSVNELDYAIFVHYQKLATKLLVVKNAYPLVGMYL